MATKTTTDDQNATDSGVARRGNTYNHVPIKTRSRKRVAETREEMALALRIKGYTESRIAKELGISQPSVHEALERAMAKRKLLTDEQLIAQKHEHTMMLEHKIEEAIDAWEKSKCNAETEKVVEKSLASSSEEEDPGPLGGRLRRRRKQPLDAGELAEDVDSLLADADSIDYESIPGYFYDEATGEETLPEERPRIVAAWVIEKLREERKGNKPVAGLLERTLTNTSQGRSGDPRYLAEIRACLAEIRRIWGTDAPVKQEFTGKDGAPISVAFSDSLARVYGLVPTPTSEEP